MKQSGNPPWHPPERHRAPARPRRPVGVNEEYKLYVTIVIYMSWMMPGVARCAVRVCGPSDGGCVCVCVCAKKGCAFWSTQPCGPGLNFRTPVFGSRSPPTVLSTARVPEGRQHERAARRASPGDTKRDTPKTASPTAGARAVLMSRQNRWRTSAVGCFDGPSRSQRGSSHCFWVAEGGPLG